MKILFINPILRTAETDCIPQVKTISDSLGFNFCNALCSVGHEVTLFAAEDYRPTQNENYPFAVIFAKSIFKSIFKPRSLPFMPYLVKCLLCTRYDLIISSEIFGMHSLTAALLRPHRTIIWHELSHHPRMLYSVPSKIWYLITRRIFNQCLAICPRSISAKKFLENYFKDNVTDPIGHGVDIKRFSSNTTPGDYFVVCSQLIPRKLIHETIAKFSNYIQRFDDKITNLIIIGDGIAKPSLQALAKEYGIESRITFLGQLSHAEMVPILSGARSLLVSSRRDLTLLSITESLACGVPVIMNNGVDYAELINMYTLGIAKDDWQAEDLHEVIHNPIYKSSCLSKRDFFSEEEIANRIIAIHLAKN